MNLCSGKYLILGLLLVILTTSKATEFNVLTENFPPFSYVSDGKTTGLCVEIMQAVFKELGHKNNIEIYPWARAYNDTLKHSNRILFPTARTPERDSQFKWVGPILVDPVYFYRKNPSEIKIDNLNDARKLQRIGLTKGYPEELFLTSRGFTNLSVTSSTEQNLKMLLRDRVNLIVSGKFALGHVLRRAKLPANSVAIAGEALFESVLYFAFSLDTSESDIELWQQALDKVKNSSNYQLIVSRYSGY